MALSQDNYYLVVSNGVRIRLQLGLIIQARNLSCVQSILRSGPIARVTANPGNAAILGLTNLSQLDWEAHIPGKPMMWITPGRTIRLEQGVTLIIGNIQTKIEKGMMNPSISVGSGWLLRITNGPLAGTELPLGTGQHYIGSGPQSDVVISDAFLAPRHIGLDVHGDRVIASNLVPGSSLSIAGRYLHTANLGPGDEFAVNGRTFLLANPSLATTRIPTLTWRGIGANYISLGVVMAGMALTLIILYLLTGVTNLIPVMLLTVSAVVPVTAIAYLVEKYDRTGISFRTLVVTFLLGGTIGIISTILLELPAAIATGGLILLPIFAGFAEEPAKLIATCWRWKHPVYDRPMDGLIIGTICGFGFAVFETAGYGLSNLLHGGVEGLLITLAIRSMFAPFGHGLWTGITAAAFWECGRNPSRVIRDPRFQKAMLTMVGLHALWNSSIMLGYLPMIVSAALSLMLYRRLLSRNGYSV